ncbi:tetratricopeptide repeat protein [Desulfotomaculum copahuensis]|uniref:Uncharacterized protein n=1 Tax=Desulfotomaculum copahuensis TaxID=1838280 RepID=A0A1B7LFB9_9FIRM|nr:tetratricopeptide repeat protein [Desulfotomaculum copahuensis]OAT82337.1 hypothetical protein A6M21_09325 [Desulfotomaculum copahuensis]
MAGKEEVIDWWMAGFLTGNSISHNRAGKEGVLIVLEDMLKPVGHEQLALARSLIRAGKLDGAMKTLKRIIYKEPGNARAFNLLGAIYEKEGNLDAARRMYRAAIALDPACRPAQANLCRLVRWPPDLSAPDLDISRTVEEAAAVKGGPANG